jgi:hypothetical protein
VRRRFSRLEISPRTVLGHATWHLYRRAVEPNPGAPPELRPESTGRRYAAEFLASLFGWSWEDLP